MFSRLSNKVPLKSDKSVQLNGNQAAVESGKELPAVPAPTSISHQQKQPSNETSQQFQQNISTFQLPDVQMIRTLGIDTHPHTQVSH